MLNVLQKKISQKYLVPSLTLIQYIFTAKKLKFKSELYKNKIMRFKKKIILFIHLFQF